MTHIGLYCKASLSRALCASSLINQVYIANQVKICLSHLRMPSARLCTLMSDTQNSCRYISPFYLISATFPEMQLATGNYLCYNTMSLPNTDTAYLCRIRRISSVSYLASSRVSIVVSTRVSNPVSPLLSSVSNTVGDTVTFRTELLDQQFCLKCDYD
jgi:hypothetical protein